MEPKMHVYGIPVSLKFLMEMSPWQAQCLAWILLPKPLPSDLSILCHTTSNPCSLVDYDNWKIFAEVLKWKHYPSVMSNALRPHGL